MQINVLPTNKMSNCNTNIKNERKKYFDEVEGTKHFLQLSF